MPKPIIAAFDFDGTLTTRDSLLPFLIDTTGVWKSAFYLFLEIPAMLGFLLGITPRQTTKERILKRFFGGVALKTLQHQGERFAGERIAKLLKPKARKRLEWHLNQGHRCILVSASIDIYLQPWIEKVGIHTLLCSRLEVDTEQKITGKLIGLNCWGPEKVRRLEEVCGPRTSYTLYAYGDSRGDKELLATADHPYYRSLT